jgi:hypothetical protein
MNETSKAEKADVIKIPRLSLLKLFWITLLPDIP